MNSKGMVRGIHFLCSFDTVLLLWALSPSATLGYEMPFHGKNIPRSRLIATIDTSSTTIRNNYQKWRGGRSAFLGLIAASNTIAQKGPDSSVDSRLPFLGPPQTASDVPYEIPADVWCILSRDPDSGDMVDISFVERGQTPLIESASTPAGKSTAE